MRAVVFILTEHGVKKRQQAARGGREECRGRSRVTKQVPSRASRLMASACSLNTKLS